MSASDLIVDGLDVAVDLASADEESPDLDAIEAVRELVAAHGLAALLEAVRDAADMAADAHSHCIAAAELGKLRAFSGAISSAVKVIA